MKQESYYLYGIDYYPSKETLPKDRDSCDILIYKSLDPNETRSIGSLEGRFFTWAPEEEIFQGADKMIVPRFDMDMFASLNAGRFVKWRKK